MCRRCIWALLVAMGCVLVFVSLFPVFGIWSIPEPWQTGLVASKIIMLPMGLACLFGAVAIKPRKVRP
jgi:hypothetical protein